MKLLLDLRIVPRGFCVRDILLANGGCFSLSVCPRERVVASPQIHLLVLRDEGNARSDLGTIWTMGYFRHDVVRAKVLFASRAIPSPHALLVRLDASGNRGLRLNGNMSNASGWNRAKDLPTVHAEGDEV
jgi:hypothetical protein